MLQCLADEAGLIRDDFDKHPVSHPGMADEGFDGGDFHEGAGRSLLEFLLELDRIEVGVFQCKT